MREDPPSALVTVAVCDSVLLLTVASRCCAARGCRDEMYNLCSPVLGMAGYTSSQPSHTSHNPPHSSYKPLTHFSQPSTLLSQTSHTLLTTLHTPLTNPITLSSFKHLTHFS